MVEKPLRYIFNFFPIFAKNLKKGEKQHRNVLDNLSYGFNIGFAYRCMLSTTVLLLATIEITIFYSLNTSLQEILNFLFDINLKKEINAIAFFSSIALFSYLLNEKLLGWHEDEYIGYFKKFEKIQDKKLGYIISLLFHLGAILLCILSIIYFEL
ncbi:hypothetical protein [Pasteurella sp. PK-2025]|uniref:hypothetical protein n=1 Tax=unclassified Pasteurella TaxID=2621516 RepID=UPI003C7692CA